MRSILKLSFVIFLLSSCTKKQETPVADLNWSPASAVEKLGYHLYFDKRLSADDSVSCNTCHNVLNKSAGVDGLPTSKGIKGQFGGRNAPTVWNAKFLSVQFWDGRAKDLAEQAKGPITNPIEMGIKSHDVAMAKIKSVAGYKDLFKKAFPNQADPVNINNLATAIAEFEKTLVNTNSPYDKYMEGDKSALSSEAIKGMNNFKTIGCVACHSGKHFAGPAFDVGTGFYMKFPTFPNSDLETKYEISKDLGRYEVTKIDADKNMWRVPTLRNIAKTGPYFHNGKVSTLKEAIKVMGKMQLNKDLTEEEVSYLEAFLNTLTGEFPEIKEPTPLK